jgi:hypothetical protein
MIAFVYPLKTANKPLSRPDLKFEPRKYDFTHIDTEEQLFRNIFTAKSTF